MYFGATELSLILPAGVSIGTNTTPITLGEVGSAIFEVSGELDSYAAGAGYGVPITPSSPVSYATMQRAAKFGVGWKILGILFPGMGGPGDTNSIVADYRTAYQTFLASLRKGEIALPDAGSGNDGRALPRSFSTSNPGACDSGASALVPINWEP